MAPQTTILVMLGAHGSGKTTLGRLAARRLGWPFDEEIGKRLRDEALRLDAGNHAAACQPDFDRRVAELEIERDRRSLGCRVVETWHPGNLAYAWQRSPAEAARLEARLRVHASSLGARVLVQPLIIDREAALNRLTQPGPGRRQMVDFFLGVAACARQLVPGFGFERLPAVRSDRCTIAEALEIILDAVACRIETEPAVYREKQLQCHGAGLSCDSREYFKKAIKIADSLRRE
jgi:hypothetical protein